MKRLATLFATIAVVSAVAPAAAVADTGAVECKRLPLLAPLCG
jgi:hypothetical protein